MSDRIAVLDAGELIQVDTPEEVYKRPRTRFIAEFFRGSNIFEASVVGTGEDTVLSFADQTVRSTDALPPGADDRATFFVRSEAIAAGGEGANALTGTITNVVYRGGTTDYTVDVGGHEVVVSLGDDGHEEGETLALSWDPADTVLLGE